MYRCIKDIDADFVKFGCFIDNADGSQRNILSQTKEMITFNRYSAVEAIIDHNKLNGILWTNLFRRELFNGLHFNNQLSQF